jgi:hypothetical protein
VRWFRALRKTASRGRRVLRTGRRASARRGCAAATSSAFSAAVAAFMRRYLEPAIRLCSTEARASIGRASEDARPSIAPRDSRMPSVA